MKIPEIGEVRKPSKTLAGVTPVAVMCKPRKCNHGTCLYCPSLNVPQSYTPKSPPVLRASILKYDSFKQIKSRLKAFSLMNHPTEKIELIIMGGNFLEYSLDYQEKFVKGCYDALNDFVSKNLESAKKKNEKAKHRCVALCIETRPDSCSEAMLERILSWGCTRVEIGVQCLDDDIYRRVNRGHNVQDVVDATYRLKEKGFKVGYHMMLGLPGSNPKKDFKMFKQLFKDERFKPDQLKIYPTQVLEGSELVKLFKRKKYHPYSKDDIQELIIKIMKIIPRYCRVMRVMREIPPEYLVAGTTRIDLRRDIEVKLKKSWKRINEIRFREIGFAVRDLKKGGKIDERLRLKVTCYRASGGKEYFLEIVNRDNILFGLCRLRVNGNGLGVVRELHVYGQSLGVGVRGNGIGQHKGLGKWLMSRAEEIARREKVEVLGVISGVGVREYYKKLEYSLSSDGVYMVKRI